jgi:hypothetical protein
MRHRLVVDVNQGKATVDISVIVIAHVECYLRHLTFVCLAAQLFSHAPPSVIIRSVMKPAHNPTKIPNIRILFVVCLLPELYMSIET